MTMLIYENVNYTRIGSGEVNSLLPIGATIELNGRGYRIVDYIVQDVLSNVIYMVVSRISKSTYSAYEVMKERGIL